MLGFFFVFENEKKNERKNKNRTFMIISNWVYCQQLAQLFFTIHMICFDHESFNITQCFGCECSNEAVNCVRWWIFSWNFHFVMNCVNVWIYNFSLLLSRFFFTVLFFDFFSVEVNERRTCTRTHFIYFIQMPKKRML